MPKKGILKFRFLLECIGSADFTAGKASFVFRIVTENVTECSAKAVTQKALYIGIFKALLGCSGFVTLIQNFILLSDKGNNEA